MVRIDPEQNERAALARLGVDLTGARVLEIGCGDGRLTKTFADRATLVVATDPDAAAIAEFRAEPWPGHVEVQCVGIEAFDPGGRRFDAVLFSWSL